MGIRRAVRAVACAVSLAVAAGAAAGQLPGVEPLHDAGQDVTPSFEGWYPNPDGTFSLSFGYLNRNLKETVDIPIGPDNRIEPGGPDQGQPTHFLPRRQMGLFTITVPKDFGSKRLTWTLVRNGKTNTTTGHIDNRWLIDALEDPTIHNKPPVIKFSEAGPSSLGPRPLFTSMSVTRPATATLDVWATDDGVTLRGDQKQAQQLNVTWQKYRGPGQVSIDKVKQDIDRTTWRATTTATFTEPGEYWLRVMANDYTGPTGASGQCCWTNGIAKISVK